MRQVSYVENHTMNMIEIVNNIVSISFDLQRQDVKVPLHLPTCRQQSEWQEFYFEIEISQHFVLNEHN